jgi:uncharacterized membrane protein
MGAKENPTRVVRLAIAAVFAAVVCVVTLVLIVNIPATKGYFNIGETVIYIAALVFGPFVGAFAGGVGAAISDLIAGPIFAPGTLVIKGCEGAIVGFLYKKMPKHASNSKWKSYTIILGIVVGILLATVGSAYLHHVDIYWGYPAPETATFSITIPIFVWYFLGGILAFAIALMTLKLEPESGQAVLPILVGGLEMVLGYYLYEQLVVGPVAIVEVAANILQMLVGLAVAIPVARIVSRRLPQFKS